MSSSILTTHVGSLPRSKELSELLFAKDKKENFDQELFDNTVKKNVEEIVKRQLQVGIDVVSDGEMSKISYATYVKDRIKGFSGESERRAPADLDAFPAYKTKIANSGGTPTYTRPCCTSELEIQDTQSLKNDIKNFSDSLTSNNHSKAFMNAASPGVINVFMPNKFYKDDDTYLEKLSEVMSPEYKLITDNNIHLQLDCPDLALARHMNYKDLSEEEFLIRAEMQIEALNNALIGIPSELVRMHICWGNYEGPHTFDIGLEKILPVILKANLKYLLIESSNPRHSHEWQVFDEIKLPKDKVVVPGVIDSTSNFVEHPQVVADRLIQFSKVIPKDQLMAGTDCGFSTFAGFGKIDEDICYAKLNSLVEGAALASKLI
ncbi:cobalamin-independent methionine synthase II family protein [Alphaproteobacteria bacterium]|nr:cobalamin-independent methionine synthase II family protein [Alphaproteobacteria bacterium]